MSEMPWWYTRDEEHLWGSVTTRDEAIEAGTRDFDGEPFFICQGGHFRNTCDIFEIDWVADRFNDANADYAGEDGDPAEDWTGEHCRELERELAATMKAWAERHGYDKAYAIDASPSERIVPASAIEAASAGETADAGSTEGESAAAESRDAQNSSAELYFSKGGVK